MATHQMRIVKIDDTKEYQEVNYQEGCTVRDDGRDNKTEDMKQLDKEKKQIYTSDQYAPADRDKNTTEASNIETKERKKTTQGIEEKIQGKMLSSSR